MNPDKANMVNNIADYRWSSYRHYALDETNILITEHPLCQDLGVNSELRAANYQKIFNTLNTAEQGQQSLQLMVETGKVKTIEIKMAEPLILCFNVI